MQQRVMNILKQIRDRWTALGTGKQIRFILAAVVLAAALGATAYFLSRPQMVVIEANMDPQELSQAITILRDSGINAQTTNNTTALSVPKGSVDNARLLLATSGIQTSEITYEDALNVGIGTTESARQVMEVKAKETQIANTLKMLNNVKSASVTLSIPNVTPFILREQDMPTASVVLETTGELPAGQVEAIAGHVSKSVANLKMENVSIMDTNGRSLYQLGPDGIAGNMSFQQEYEAAKKYEIENQVRQLLAPQFNMVEAVATLDFDWTGTSTRSTSYRPYDPEATTGLPSRETLSESAVENTDPAAEPGVQANNGQTPEYPTGTGTNSSATRTDSDRDYLYDVEESQTNLSPGRWIPDNSTIAVVVYNNRIYREDDLRENGSLDNTSWDDFKTNTMAALVSIDLTNGQALNLVRNATNMQNVVIEGYELPVFIDSEVTTRPINQLLMAGLLLLIIGLLAFGLIRRTQPVEIEEIEPELLVEDMLVSSEAQQAAAEEPVPEIDYFAESELKKQIDKFIDEKPEAAAQLLRNWLSEEWD